MKHIYIQNVIVRQNRVTAPYPVAAIVCVSDDDCKLAQRDYERYSPNSSIIECEEIIYPCITHKYNPLTEGFTIESDLAREIYYTSNIFNVRKYWINNIESY